MLIPKCFHLFLTINFVVDLSEVIMAIHKTCSALSQMGERVWKDEKDSSNVPCLIKTIVIDHKP